MLSYFKNLLKLLFKKTFLKDDNNKENIAAKYLKKRGYEIIERNFRSKFTDVDIIAKHKKYLCFIEVKYRKNNYYHASVDAIDHVKMRRLTMAAQYFIKVHPKYQDVDVRFDVVAIDGNKIQLIENAFYGIDCGR